MISSETLDRLASSISQRLSGSSDYVSAAISASPLVDALASAIASRLVATPLSSFASSSFTSPVIDTGAVASAIAMRLAASSSLGASSIVDVLASAVTARIRSAGAASLSASPTVDVGVIASALGIDALASALAARIGSAEAAGLSASPFTSGTLPNLLRNMVRTEQGTQQVASAVLESLSGGTAAPTEVAAMTGILRKLFGGAAAGPDLQMHEEKMPDTEKTGTAKEG